MNKFLLGIVSVLLLVIVGELVFINFVKKQITQKASFVPNTTIQFPYEENELKASNGNFMKILENAKKTGYSLDQLSWYLLGANITKKQMVSQYLITVTAQGQISSIINTSKDGLKITLRDAKNEKEEMVYNYLPAEKKIIEIKSNIGKKGELTDLKKGDTIKISDTFDMKSSTTTKVIIEQ